MKKVFVVVILLILIPIKVEAQRGCCSHHGGVSGCTSNGKQLCKDGTVSPTCTCTPPAIYGCTDSKAKNYNPNATKSNGKCTYYVKGCTDKNAINYNSKAEKDDGSCIKKVLGCTNKEALNYNEKANTDDDSCIKKVLGCTDKKALNYNEKANVDDDSCEYKQEEIEEKDLSANETQNSNKKEDIQQEKSEETNDGGAAVVGVGVLGTSGYLIYRKRKNKKEYV